MKYTLLYVFFFITVLISRAQTDKPYDLIPYRKDSLWGYADTNKHIVIAPQFDEVKFFNDGATGVLKGKKWAIIDKKGKTLTDFKYEAVGDFTEGLAPVMFNKKVGYINTKGKEIVTPQYKFCEDFSEGLGVIRDSVNGKLLSGAVDKSGKVILPLNYNMLTSQFHSGYIAVYEHDKAYFMDKTGKKLNLPGNVLPYQEFAEGVALVKVMSLQKSETKTDTVYYLGLVNSQGKIIADSVTDMNKKKLPVNDEYLVGLNYMNGFALLQHKFKDYNLYYGSFDNNEFAFLDKTGKLSKWYVSARAFSAEGYGVIMEKGSSTASFIDKQFHDITTGISITDAGMFSDGLLRVQQQYGLWNYMDVTGKVMFDQSYTEASEFLKGVAVVKYQGKQVCINKQGIRFAEE